MIMIYISFEDDSDSELSDTSDDSELSDTSDSELSDAQDRSEPKAEDKKSNSQNASEDISKYFLCSYCSTKIIYFISLECDRHKKPLGTKKNRYILSQCSAEGTHSEDEEEDVNINDNVFDFNDEMIKDDDEPLTPSQEPDSEGRGLHS